MIEIHFIVNPISGKGMAAKLITTELLGKKFDKKKYNCKLYYSKHRDNILEIIDGIKEKEPDIVVVCGGDGTINQVASALVDTDVTLGIIPMGSGNGLSRNLSIPFKVNKALKKIKKGKTKKIDVGVINDRYFFSNIGFGIDASVVKNYEKEKKREFKTYAKATVKTLFNYKPKEVNLEITTETEKEQFKLNPFLLFISNSNQMGYNVSLTPKAKLRDGYLDMFIFPKSSYLQILIFGLTVFLKKPNFFKKSIYKRIKRAKITLDKDNDNPIQIDGELYEDNSLVYKVEILKKRLKVLC